jgi:hypothetical protein
MRANDMKNRRNYYRILQVQRDAPVEVIRSSYRTLMRELKQHPDLGGATSKAALLNEAYETLSDAGRRAEYDRTLAPLKRKGGEPAGAGMTPPVAKKHCPLCRKPLTRDVHSGDRCPDCEIPLSHCGSEGLDSKQRRAVSRMEKSGRIRYCSSWPQQAREGEMIDLSPKGMRLLCSEKLERGRVLKIMAPLLTASAVVANCRKTERAGETYYAVGVYFVAVEFGDPKGSFLSVKA